jgi:hypothetical protein
LEKDIKKRFEDSNKQKEEAALQEVEGAPKLSEEEEKYIEEALSAREEPLEDEEKAEEVKRLKYKFMTEQLCKEESMKEILSFKDYKVIKMTRIF